MTYTDKLQAAMAVQTQQQADDALFDLADSNVRAGMAFSEALALQRKNLGYIAGYYNNETRARVERLFKCEHPIFGAIALNGPPTPEQAFQAGLDYAICGKMVTTSKPESESEQKPKRTRLIRLDF